MESGTKIYFTHRRNRPTKHQRQRGKAKLARRAKKALEANPPLPPYETTEEKNPPLPILTEENERLKTNYKNLRLEEKIKIFRNSLCGSCLSNGINTTCFGCFEENNKNDRIAKKKC